MKPNSVEYQNKLAQYYIKQLSAGKKPAQPQQTKGRGGFLSSLISEASGAGGAAGGAALGTAVLPGLGTILGAIGGGFLGGTSGRLAENKVRDDRLDFNSLKQSLGEGAWSGALSGAGTALQVAKASKALTGLKGFKGVDEAAKAPELFKAALRGGKVGAIDDVTKAAKLTGGRNIPTRGGQSLYRSTLGIDDIVMPGKMKPSTIFKADDLVNEARRVGLKGTPKAMQRQVATQYDFLNKSVDDILSKAKSTTSANKLLSQAKKEIAEKLPLRVDGVPIRQELLRSLNQLGKGNVNAKTLNAFKQGLDIDNAFRKLSGELASPLTAKETVDLALWKQADKWISDLAPAAKELTTRQSKLYGLAHGLGRMTRTPGDPKGVVDLAARVVGPSVRKAQNFVGRGLLDAGAVEGAVGDLGGGLLSSAGRQAAYQAPGNVAEAFSVPVDEPTQAPQEELAPVLPEVMGASTVEQTPSYTLRDALGEAQKILGGKATAPQYLAYAKALMAEQPEASGPNVTKVTAQQYGLAETGATALQQLSQLIQQDPSIVGRTATPGRGLPIIGGYVSNAAGTGEYDAIGYNIADSILRLRTGAQANESEVKKLQSQIMPRAGDSPQTIKSKLAQINQIFSGVLNQAQQPGGGSGMDISSLIGEVSGAY